MTNLIIDGHGTDLPQAFNFQRAQGNECTLYSYVRTGISIPVRQSDNIIAKIIKNDYSKEITTMNASQIGGTQLNDRELSAIQLTPPHVPAAQQKPEWNNDTLFTEHPVNTVVNGITMQQITHGNTIYLRLPVGSAQTIKLSEIINAYHTGQYNIFWCVCR